MEVRNRIPKSEARKIILSRKKEITPADAGSKTKAIVERLSTLDEFVIADKILTYVSSGHSEVDSKQIIKLADDWGKSVFIPKLNEPSDSFRVAQFTTFRELIVNRNGFHEPGVAFEAEISDIDLIIIPCLAVSLYGQRVGSGGRYYDKLLKMSYAPKIAVVFEFQLLKDIEYENHDIRIDKIITERRVIDSRIH